MVRVFLLLGLALLLGGMAALALRDNPGYVLIEFGGWQLETTLAALALLLAVGGSLLLLLLRALRGLLVMPRQVAAVLERKRVNRARAQFERGMLALHAERWQAAELALLRYVSDAPVPALNYLGAAEAAHRQGAVERREHYLSLAEQTEAEVAGTVAMARARWAADSADWAQALAALEEVQKHRGAGAREVQALRLDVLEHAGRWQELRDTLPKALGALPRPQLDALTARTERALLQQAGERGDLEGLRTQWLALPRSLRADADMLALYCTMLHRLGADSEALRLIPPAVKKQWHAELVLLYGRLHAEDRIAQLAAVEDWLNRYGEKPELLLIAGRLCIHARLWGRARSYLEACQKQAPSAEVALELGRLRAQEKDELGALRAYQQGLELALEPPRAPGKAPSATTPPAGTPGLPAPQTGEEPR